MKDVDKFLRALEDGVENEHAEEVRESEKLLRAYTPLQVQRAGLGLINLKVGSTRSGLGGKCLADLEPATPGITQLPAHKLRPGDIVALDPHSSEDRKDKPGSVGAGGKNGSNFAISGVVYRVSDCKITLVLDDDVPDHLQDKCRITRLANEVTYKRLRTTLGDLKAQVNGSPESLVRVLMGASKPTFNDLDPSIKLFNPNLNASQKEAVRLCLAAHDLALIHGPPGTGKTQTLIEVILQFVAQKQKVLVCGPSNISVDNVVERLAPSKIPMLRVGHPARILPSVLAHSLDVQVKTCAEGQVVADVVKEIDDKLGTVRKTRNGAERRQIYRDVKDLRKELRVREANVVANLLREAKVVLTTLNGAGSKKLAKESYDVVVIDECAQALEPECWIALLKGKRAILAGDHLQLPPTIKSQKASALATTLFERVLKHHGSEIMRLLTVQYRMHDLIMQFPSKRLYEGKLEAHESVRAHRLVDFPQIDATDTTKEVLVLYDTAGADMFESVVEEGPLASESKFNEGEADLVAAHVDALCAAGLRAIDIVVLTPYNAQVGLLSERLHEKYPDLEIGSVDGMQGREKEAVIVSLVRSNDKHEIGFLSDERRLNVAMTRARRHLCVVGDSDTIAKSPFCQGLVDHMTEHGDLKYPGY